MEIMHLKAAVFRSKADIVAVATMVASFFDSSKEASWYLAV